MKSLKPPQPLSAGSVYVPVSLPPASGSKFAPDARATSAGLTVWQSALLLIGKPNTLICGSFTIIFESEVSTPSLSAPVVLSVCTNSTLAVAGTKPRIVKLPEVGGVVAGGQIEVGVDPAGQLHGSVGCLDERRAGQRVAELDATAGGRRRLHRQRVARR